MALFCILCWNNLRNLFPVLVVKLFDEFGILNHKCKQPVLKEMRLIILPLC
jgi:hypothetical protein